MRPGGLLFIAIVATTPQLASGRAQAAALSIPAQDLAATLEHLADVSGTNLLYDPAIISGVHAPATTIGGSIDEALAQLLAGTGIHFRRIDNHTIVLSRQGTPLEQPAAIPEILVVGRRYLNLDIPRSPDDIQPYRVIDAQTVARSGAQTVDDFLKTRITSNAIALSSVQAPNENNAATVSQIDLRGLGTDQTLVLVDGHRLPSYPGAGVFQQSNLNGIPVGAIERIEILPSTAGAIYGPDSTGGVVNVVLKHDPHGLDLSMTKGVSARGDAPNWRIDAHWGFESADGRTQFSAFYSHSRVDGLDQGERSYVQQAQSDSIVSGKVGGVPPSSPSVNIVTLFSPTLTLKPQYGGQSLGARFTTIPLSAIGGASMTTDLLANAGRYDLSLSPDGEGAKQTTLTTVRNDGIDLSLRHRFSPAIEAYVDFIGSRTVGTATGTLRLSNNTISIGLLSAASPYNPFNQYIEYSFPQPALDTTLVNRTRTYRATGGLIIDLPFHWRADVDLSQGATDVRARFPPGNLAADYLATTPNLFADPAGFSAALQAAAGPTAVMKTSDRMLDANIKLAGPLFRLPGGTATMTVSGEVRREHNPGTTYTVSPGGDAVRNLAPEDSGDLRQHVESLYDEVRLPILPASTGFFPLRDLELQFAGRMDHYAMSVPSASNTLAFVYGDLPPDFPPTARARDTTFAFTAGGRVRPIDGVMLRASYATGYHPPTAAQIQPLYDIGYGNDPKRGGEFEEYLLNRGGSGALKPEKSQSLSAGIVLTPKFVPGLRLSADYVQIHKTHEVNALFNEDSFFLANEGAYPGRIIRAPLTADDIAQGFTGGEIEEINASSRNTGKTTVHAVDFDGSYALDTRWGRFTLNGHASWEPTYRTNAQPDKPTYETAGYFDGPVKWKGNGGIAWEKGRLSAGANVQVYGHYKITFGGYDGGVSSVDNVYRVKLQGSDHIPTQTYADIFMGYRIPANGRRPGIGYLLTVNNVLDKRVPAYLPTIDPNPSTMNPTRTGYSYYGDPRGRRFELTIDVSL